MNREPGFPTSEDMSSQFPLFLALVRKDFRKNLYGDFPTMAIRNGIILFLFCCMVAMGLRDDPYSEAWTSLDVMEMVSIMGIFLLIFPMHFIGGISAETLQGTFRNISLYPVGVNTLTTSKLAYSVLSTGSLLTISLFCILTPFFIMDVITLRLGSYLFIIGGLLFLAYFLTIFAGSYFANISAADDGTQNIGGYGFLSMCGALFLSYWPVRVIMDTIFKMFDPDATYAGVDEAHLIGHYVSHISPYEMAFQYSRSYILGAPLDPGYLICIPLWLLIGIQGIRHGRRVYMDVFFRRV
jgi:hypothetical protein